jgi:prophage antirepressor
MENSNIKIFEKEEFGKIRAKEIDGVVWFSGKDIASALGYENERRTVREFTDESDRLTVQLSDFQEGTDFVPSHMRGSKIVLINEFGVYSLILSSKLQKAKEFKRWITHEVIPSIMRTGVYATPEAVQKYYENPEAMAELFHQLAEEQNKRKLAESNLKEVRKMLKVKEGDLEFYRYVTDSDGLMLTTEVAKYLGTGPGILNKLLLKFKIIRKLRSHYELTSKYVGKNFAKLVYIPYYENDPNRPTSWTKQLEFTTDGKNYIGKWFKRIGLIDESGGIVVFNKEKAKEILGIKSDEELDELNHSEEFLK